MCLCLLAHVILLGTTLLHEAVELVDQVDSSLTWKFLEAWMVGQDDKRSGIGDPDYECFGIVTDIAREVFSSETQVKVRSICRLRFFFSGKER